MPARKVKGSWYVDFRLDGRRYRRKSPIDTKGGAQEYETVLKQRLLAGGSLDESPASSEADCTLAVFASRWLSDYVDVRNSASERRQKRLVLRNHLLPALGSKRLAKLQGGDVHQYLRDKQRVGLSNKTLNNHLTILRRCLRSALEWGLITTLPPLAPLPVEPVEMDYLAPEECGQLLADHSEPMWSLMVHMALGTGMRLGELIAVRREDFDLQHRLLTIRRSIVRGVESSPKARKIRHVPVPRDLADALTDWPATGRVIARPDGSAVSDSMAYCALRRIRRRTGVRHIGWHGLRHTYASELARRGTSPHVIQRLMGHSSLSVTERYMHLAPDTVVNEAREVLDQMAIRPQNRGHYLGIGRSAAADSNLATAGTSPISATKRGSIGTP